MKNGGIKACDASCRCHTEKYLSELKPERADWQAFPGERYGRLVVKSEPYFKVFRNSKQYYKMQYVVCECDCKTITEVRCRNLREGKTQSCSCLRKDAIVKAMKGSRAENGFKKCSQCGFLKKVSEFKPSSYTKDSLKSSCGRCEKNAELLSLYGITLEDYERLAEKQDGQCAICKSIDPKTPSKRKKLKEKFFCIDHDHQTGRIRGLLCFNCNTGLGQFGDSKETVEAALNYLKEPPSLVKCWIADKNKKGELTL